MRDLKMLLKLVIFSLCLKVVLTFPDGAPEAACETLTPVHGLNQPNPMDNPIEIIPEFSHIHAGDLMSVDLRVRNDTIFGPLQFRGFIIQARIDDPNMGVAGRVVGSWELSEGARHVPCTAFPPNSVATHTSNSDKTFVRLLWRAPTNVFQDVVVRFYYSIVWMVPVFWTNTVSIPITVVNFG